MSNQVVNLVQIVNSAKPAEIPELDLVKNKFIDIYNKIHGSSMGETIYHKEVFNFKKLIAEKPDLKECSNISLYGCFLDINVNGHSLEQGPKPDCYIIARNFKTGKKDDQGRDVYEKRATLQVSPYGELKLRMRAGQIKYADNPVIVYEGDLFKVKLTATGAKSVEYEAELPRKSKKIIGSFIRIVRTDNSVDYQVFTVEDINRWAAASNKNNFNKGANALYTSTDGGIDAGFLAAKTIKHAFATYPKVATGKFSELPEDIITPADQVDYGLGDEEITPHEEVHDDLDQALQEAKIEKSAETVKITSGTNEDEPEF